MRSGPYPEPLPVESLSVFDLFKIGVGPSSSHTLGPWQAARRFVRTLREAHPLGAVDRLQVDLFGSLAKTGLGHGTDLAVLMGLADADPESCDTTEVPRARHAVQARGQIALGGTHPVPFDVDRDLRFHRDQALPFHPNALTFTAHLRDGHTRAETYYSIGGGFLVRDGESPAHTIDHPAPPYPFATAATLLGHARASGLSIPAILLQNERTWRDDAAIAAGLRHIWDTMRACVFRGCTTPGILPGPLGVVRRAPRIHAARIAAATHFDSVDAWQATLARHGGGFRETLEWVSAFALAVNEENAAFGRVVTAPTNGAAGVVPAVLLYHVVFGQSPHADTDATVAAFLLTAAAIGALFKQGATISAAQGGCQAEIGVSSAMAAAGLAQVLGASPAQVLMAAEIAMEHHLGLTCDPIAGLVQVPCIERNTMGAIKAITACELALASDPAHAKVHLDAVIRTMWATAQDMNTKYKETAEGGLAILVPVNVPEC
jgi:L-serine dehydratase